MNYDTALNQAISETISDTGAAVIATESLEAGGFFTWSFEFQFLSLSIGVFPFNFSSFSFSANKICQI